MIIATAFLEEEKVVIVYLLVLDNCIPDGRDLDTRKSVKEKYEECVRPFWPCLMVSAVVVVQVHRPTYSSET